MHVRTYCTQIMQTPNKANKKHSCSRNSIPFVLMYISAGPWLINVAGQVSYTGLNLLNSRLPKCRHMTLHIGALKCTNSYHLPNIAGQNNDSPIIYNDAIATIFLVSHAVPYHTPLQPSLPLPGLFFPSSPRHWTASVLKLPWLHGSSA